MKYQYTIILSILLSLTAGKNIFQTASDFSAMKSNVSNMMANIRRDGADGSKTIIMEYGDSISNGWGSSDYYKLSSWALLNNALQSIDPSF